MADKGLNDQSVRAAIERMRTDVSSAKVKPDQQYFQKAVLQYLEGLALIHKAFCLVAGEGKEDTHEPLLTRAKGGGK
jgi:hypothetical protein